jgi:hypothetical protein
MRMPNSYQKPGTVL